MVSAFQYGSSTSPGEQSEYINDAAAIEMGYKHPAESGYGLEILEMQACMVVFFVAIIVFLGVKGLLKKESFNFSQQDDCIRLFFQMQDTHEQLCTFFLASSKQASDSELGLLIRIMSDIRKNCPKVGTDNSVDSLAFSAFSNIKDAITLFQDFQKKVFQCEQSFEVERGYAYMALSVTLLGQINQNLTPYSISLWQELKRGIDYCRDNLNSEEFNAGKFDTIPHYVK